MKPVLLAAMMSVMMAVSANAANQNINPDRELIGLHKMTYQDEVAIQRGWSPAITQCFQAKYSDVKNLSPREKKYWLVVQDYSKGYVELKDAVNDFIWRCEATGVKVFTAEDGWGFTSYEEYGWF